MPPTQADFESWDRYDLQEPWSSGSTGSRISIPNAQQLAIESSATAGLTNVPGLPGCMVMSFLVSPSKRTNHSSGYSRSSPCGFASQCATTQRAAGSRRLTGISYIPNYLSFGLNPNNDPVNDVHDFL